MELGLGIGPDLHQDVAGAGLLLFLELLAVLLVIGFEVAVGDRDPRAQDVGVHEEVGGHPLLREPVRFAFGLEAGPDLLVARLRIGAESRGIDEHVLGLHLLVAAAELALRLGRGDSGFLGHEAFELIAEHATSQRLLELGHGHALELQPTLDLRAAHETAVLLELGGSREHLGHGGVRHAEPEAAGLEDDEALLDQPLKHLLFEAESAQHGRIQLAALVEPLVELPLTQVRALKLAHGDRLFADEGKGLSRASRGLALKGGYVEDDEGGDDDPEEDVQPPSMPPH